jgi:release factor glutamine methyltransferase
LPKSPDPQDLWREATRRLSDAGIEGARLDARLLLEAAFGWKPHALILGTPEVSAEGLARFEGFLNRRLVREPVSRILGLRDFWSLPFQISPATLDPRPDSETLVQAILDRTEHTAPLRLLDLGTGSGCLLIALLTERPNAWGVGVDRTPQAAAMAHLNAHALRVADRAAFAAGDWTNPLAGRFDVILSNPPYIPLADRAGLAPDVRDYDPALALFGGVDGLDPYRRFAGELQAFLVPGGLLALEIGWDQGEAVQALLQQAGWHSVACLPDLGGRDRVIVANSPQIGPF